MERKCEVEGCKNKAKAIIRTKKVCDKHYQEIKKDNLERNKLGLNIPKQLKKLKGGNKNG